MYETAAREGFYSWPGTGEEFQKIQIITVEEMLEGQESNLPIGEGSYAKAPVHEDTGKQLRID